MDYVTLYNYALQKPDKYWESYANRLYFEKKWERAIQRNEKLPIAKWFVNGLTNISYNSLSHSGKAIIFYHENGKRRDLTFNELNDLSSRIAGLLLDKGLKKGDRIAIYMPNMIETIATILASARLGVIYSLIFAGLGIQAINNRLNDLKPKLVISTDKTIRRGKEIKLYTELSDIIIKRNDEFDYDRKYDNFEWIESNEPLKIMYTSGTTGKPKGIILPHGSWMVGDYTVFDLMFSLKPNDIVLTTTDVGWITFSRIMYGTLTHGSTLAFLEGAPDFPDNRLANIIDELQPKVLFTSPTLLRNLQKLNVKLPKVEFVATAGEIMDETAWKYALSFSDKVTDVYGQTELGYVVGYPYSLEGISPKVGYAGLPFPGSVMDTLDEAGKSVRQEVGYLVSKTPFPTQFIGVWNDNEKFLSYFKRFNYHDTGDLAIIDAEGYIKIVGRNDDMIKVAGHRITSGEVESVINSINGVVESAVVGIPDEIKGEKLVVFYVGSAEEKEIISSVKKLLGPIYVIDKVYRVERLPKSRSGKIVRRILRDILLGKEVDETILEDGEVIKEIKNEISRS
ncbi:AMP-dependent synthetase [Sulfolobus sp. A20]|uniref:AMP-binding protein n=1 Tax=Saccharolobus sp. A20 TaxID=1891280 RepID=UPI000845D425|nr:AMP-binding protein [Sulfolobus sp. A20]TRM76867.1 AMP-dependent synthetase [Sulfolobus sp. A20-N-F8]TRM80515.1 AMP-dependent synthetase [Sulfolobus sp. D5]TRM94888.1 AMP-dependent synthetase [Sulfolobus sp. A20-N-G8]TRN02926.1 AMP-dependent synthetase [Sulfolobus sp. E1]AOL16941.1 AMP-dependent synthetase [Sulfolobus sp. A20]